MRAPNGPRLWARGRRGREGKEQVGLLAGYWFGGVEPLAKGNGIGVGGEGGAARAEGSLDVDARLVESRERAAVVEASQVGVGAAAGVVTNTRVSGGADQAARQVGAQEFEVGLDGDEMLAKAQAVGERRLALLEVVAGQRRGPGRQWTV